MAQAKIELINYAAKLYNAEVRICGNPNEMEDARRIYGDSILPMLSVEDWLYQMKHCSFYIGDSYHALCFCLIFHKPFVIVYGAVNHGFAGERFHSLLKLVGMEERFFDTVDDLEKIKRVMEKPCEWNIVDACLEKLRIESLAWLKEALEQPQNSNHNTVERRIHEKEKRKTSELSIKLLEQEKQIEQLKRMMGGMEKKLENEKKQRSILKRGIQCISDHGLGYTIKLGFTKYIGKV